MFTITSQSKENEKWQAGSLRTRFAFLSTQLKTENSKLRTPSSSKNKPKIRKKLLTGGEIYDKMGLPRKKGFIFLPFLREA